jgi:FEZ-like protein
MVEFVSGLTALPVRDLAALVDELEGTVRLLSETLVTELAEREEQEFLKELNNQFISLLLSIQRRRREATTSSRAVTPTAGSPAADKKKTLIVLKPTAKTKESNPVNGVVSSIMFHVLRPGASGHRNN